MASTLVLSNFLLEQQVLGMGLMSPLTIDPSTGDFMGVEGEDDVRQCIRDLLGVRVGDRVMREDDGSPLPPLVFANRDGLVNVLPQLVVETITRYEPRVLRVTANGSLIVGAVLSTIEVDVGYVLRATGTPGSLVYPFYLEPTGGTQ